jgi:hypothetical protein
VLADCRHLLRSLFQQYNGHEVDTQGDAFFVAFARATDSISAVIDIQRALADHAWPDGASVRVRIGLHTGEPLLTADGYIGMDVHHAARIRHFPPQTLLSRLEHGFSVLSGGARDLPSRQQTLRGAIAWSYDLLSPEEQRLFRCLAVFMDGWSLQAAEEVCTVSGSLEGDILEGLSSLVDKSLLRQEEQAEGEVRFWMLQTLREFGLEQLKSTGELEGTREVHAEYYLRLAEEAEPYLRETEQGR